MIYRGRVTAVDERGAYVRVGEFGPTPLGPLRWIGVAPIVGASVVLADAGDPATPDLVVLGTVVEAD